MGAAACLPPSQATPPVVFAWPQHPSLPALLQARYCPVPATGAVYARSQLRAVHSPQPSSNTNHRPPLLTHCRAQKLAGSAGGSASKRPVQPISALNPYNNNWAVKAKVVSKGPKRRCAGGLRQHKGANGHREAA